MKKEYGKFTADQFRDFVKLLPHLRNEDADLRRILNASAKADRPEMFIPGSSWSWVYELSLIEHLLLLLHALNQAEKLDAIAQSTDPTQSLYDWGQEDAPEGQHPDFQRQDIIALVYALGRTLQSLFLFERSLSGLVQEVREHGNIDSMFKAISVDRSVMTCPTVISRIAEAELFNDTSFFKQLRSAIQGPSKKNMVALADLKYSFTVLREMGLDNLSDDDLEKLMVHTLEVYADRPSARKNLRAHYQKSRKLKTI